MSLTVGVLIVATLVLIGYDIYAVVRGGIKATISWVLYTSAQKYPILPFVFGLLFGHLFWSQVC